MAPPQSNAPEMPTPPPPGWNKTIADLFDEMRRGERKSVGGPEVEWARAYERSQLPSDTRFPRKGDLYEAIEDMEVKFLTSWSAPYTGSGKGMLRMGDQVRVDDDPLDDQAISTYAVAVDYAALEERLVSFSDRKEPRYSGFYFSLSTADLNRRFKLIQSE